MLSILGARQHLCDRLNRRTLLRVGALGAIELALPRLLGSESRAPRAYHAASFGRAERCVLLFLTGGPPQLDTWDLKPEAPADIRGEFAPIDTTVPGVQICELFPRLARHADNYCLVRTVTHGDAIHTSAGYTMLTGVPHPQANGRTAKDIRPTPNDHPHIGSLLASVRSPRAGMPVFASLPEVIRDAGINEYPGQGAGFLAAAHEPFRIQRHAVDERFQLPEIVLQEAVSADRLTRRGRLLDEFDCRLLREQRPELANLEGYYQQALGLIRSDAARNAFDLDREPASVRETYGGHLPGQGCLLARRLLEAGVRLVTVYWHYEGPDDSPVWDTHQNNFPHLRNRLIPPTDQALAALLGDLETRGMLDSTLVICMGEFGRTPKINRHGGRDHWPGLQSVLLAGGGVRGGTTYGLSDRTGTFPADRPVAPSDLTATILHLLGVPGDLDLRDRTGRALRACDGTVVDGVLA